MARTSYFFSRSAALGLAVLLAGCGIAGGPGVNASSQAGVGAMGKTEVRTHAVLQFRDVAQLDQLAASGVDLFENVDLKARTVGATLTPQTRAIIDKLGVKFKMTQAITAKGFPAGYATVEAIQAELDQLANAYPKLAQVVEFGKSLEGRPLRAIKLTAKPGENLPAVRLAAGIHARELVPVELMRNLTKTLLEGYGKDAAISRLLDTRQIWIVPVQNPDGRARVEGGSPMWRKNARPLGLGANGVDINRNADDHFSEGNSSKWADDYHGEFGFSEPETVALKNLAEKVRFAASIDVHCYGGMLLWPPGYSRDLSNDEAKFAAIGGKMGQTLGYRYGTIARTIYKTFGDFATWEWAKLGTLAFAAELNDGEFGPGYGQVEKDWKAWRDNFLFFIDAGGGNTKARHATEGHLLGFGGF